MRPGDVISQSSALVGWNEREGPPGLTLFGSFENRWENQNGKMVRTRPGHAVVVLPSRG